MENETDLHERLTKNLAKRRQITDSASGGNRGFTAREKESIEELRREGEIIEEKLALASYDKPTRKAAGRQDVGGDGSEGIADRDLKKYSLVNILSRMMAKEPIGSGSFEAECSQEMAKNLGGKAAKGIYIPGRILAAAVTTTTGTGGVSTVTSSDFIDALRNVTVTGKLGITFLNGLQGKFALPRVSTDATAEFVAEGIAPTASSAALDAITLSPHSLMAYQDFTRSFTKQTNIDVELLARRILFGSIGAGFDTAILNGTGGSVTLLGVLNHTDSALVTAINQTITSSGPVAANLTGAALTWASMVALETAVIAQNVIIDSGGYVLSPGVQGQGKTIAKASNAPEFILQGGKCNDYPAYATNCIPSTNGTNSSSASATFGNWSDLVVGRWGTIDFQLDPFSLSTSAGLRTIAAADFDSGLRHGGSFARMYGIKV